MSDLQVNFDLDESDMRVFSDEDTTHIFSNRSSMEHIQNTTMNNVSLIFILLNGFKMLSLVILVENHLIMLSHLF